MREESEMQGIETPHVTELVVMGIAVLMVQAGVAKHLLSRRPPQHARRPKINLRRRRH
jgi:hypothetical protein